MAYYRTCPFCGSNNDPGEICDCQDKKEVAAPVRRERPQAKITYGQRISAAAKCQARTDTQKGAQT